MYIFSKNLKLFIILRLYKEIKVIDQNLPKNSSITNFEKENCGIKRDIL